ncbi:hypothetical protein N9K06_00600 [Omnitrophica bacterium]|nr:hypothetical protein [Candidatus Omnitrophota bacterium]
MIKALESEELAGLNLQTMIVYEGPYVGDGVINNTNLDTIIRIHGTADVLDGDDPIPFLDDRQYVGINADGTERPIKTYNIEILGAAHSDFDAQNNPQVNLFMRDLSLKAADNDPNRLKDFLSSATPGVTEDPVTHVITVDPTQYISPYGDRI